MFPTCALVLRRWFAAPPIAHAVFPIWNAELPTGDMELPTRYSVPPNPTAELLIAISELRIATAELRIMISELPIATAELPIATAELPIATAELPIATAELPIATAKLRIVISELPIATAELRIVISELPIATGRIAPVKQWPRSALAVALRQPRPPPPAKPIPTRQRSGFSQPNSAVACGIQPKSFARSDLRTNIELMPDKHSGRSQRLVSLRSLRRLSNTRYAAIP